MPVPTPADTLFFLCDIQAIFRSSIPNFDHVVFTTNKLLKLANIIGCEVVSTTQVAKSLGPLDPAIDLETLGPSHLGPFDKTSFSMITPKVESILLSRPAVRNIVLFGIEAHICVLQTAISLLHPSFRSEPYTPYIMADGIASHDSFQVPIALRRLQQEGAFIATSESISFQLIGDSTHPQFKTFNKMVKETKEGTTQAGEALILGIHASGPKSAL